jgi:transitional endoplasmic reticulum ATPase
LESNDGILFLGSTNHLDNIDSAIRSRPSRFDRKFAFELPDHKARERYAQYWRSKLAHNEEVDFPVEICGLAAELTVDFSFAYLKELFISTLLTVSKGVRDEDVEWDVINDKSTSASDSGEEISTTEATEVPSTTDKDDKATKTKDTDKKDDKKKAEEKPLRKKREVPKIAVPEDLKKNVFLAVLQQQAKLLIKDMDNSEEEETKEKEKKEKEEEKEKKKEEDHSCAKC